MAQDLDRLSLDEIATGLDQPIGIYNAGDGSNRLFIIEQDGVIRIYKNDALQVTAFLDIRDRVDSLANEQGLLGLAFHPDYANNGVFFVNYTRDPGPGPDLTVVSRFSVSAGNADTADASSEHKIIEIPQDAGNHNGGEIQFGPDGYLYIAMGDGGGGNDQYDHAQNLDSLKGAILRINVDGPTPETDLLLDDSFEESNKCGVTRNYWIPPNNPFADGGGCPEIWSFGLRNPWRFSFDPDTGDMFIGDVGQNAYEEINHEPPGNGGRNYGWSCREGLHNFFNGNACISAWTDPILEELHTEGHCSITGGYMYRGIQADFDGYYFYGDYCSSIIWLANDTGSGWNSSDWSDAASTLTSISSFGVDEAGELYVTDRNAGKVYQILISDPP